MMIYTPQRIGLSPRSRSQGKKVYGFTLVELLLVLVLIAILAGSMVVSLTGRKESFSLQTSARDLAATIRFAGQFARQYHTTCRVRFDESSRYYQMEHLAASDPALDFIPVRGQAGRQRSLAEGIQITGITTGVNETQSLPEWLEFYRDGSGFAGRIELANQKEETIAIEVIPITGQVHVQE